MKKITTPQGIIAVDESAEIKGFYHDSFTDKIYNSGGAEYVKSDQVNKIIASEFFISKDIPMFVIEDEVEIGKLAKEITNKFYPIDKIDYPIAEAVGFQKGIIECYKSSQEKNVYSEEDLRKAISKAVRAIDPVILGTAYYILEENIIINSIKESIEFEMESDTTEIDNCNKFNLETGCILPNCKCANSDLQRIKTTTDYKDQKWCYLKFK